MMITLSTMVQCRIKTPTMCIDIINNNNHNYVIMSRSVSSTVSVSLVFLSYYC